MKINTEICAVHSKLDIYECHYYRWINTSSGGLLVTEVIICPVVGVPTLTSCIRYILQSWRWAPVLRPKISKTFFGPVNFSFYLEIFKRNNRIWFRAVNPNVHFEDCIYVWNLQFLNNVYRVSVGARQGMQK